MSYGMESTNYKDYSDYLDDNFIDEIIDNAFTTPADENDTTHGWDGLLFQIAGGVTIKTVTLSQPNIYFNNVVNETFGAEE